MKNVTKERKKRVERSRKNASVEKKKKLDEKVAKRRQRKEEISRRRQSRYIMQLKSELDDVKQAEEIDEEKIIELQREVAKAEAKVMDENGNQEALKSVTSVKSTSLRPPAARLIAT